MLEADLAFPGPGGGTKAMLGGTSGLAYKGLMMGLVAGPQGPAGDSPGMQCPARRVAGPGTGGMRGLAPWMWGDGAAPGCRLGLGPKGSSWPGNEDGLGMASARGDAVLMGCGCVLSMSGGLDLGQVLPLQLESLGSQVSAAATVRDAG